MISLSDYWERLKEEDGQRPEFADVGKSVVERLLFIFALAGLPAVLLGAFQSYQQGRWGFSAVYLTVYLLFVLASFASRNLSSRGRALILVSSLFLLALAVLLRIGLSGSGLPLLIAVCFLSALLLGLREGVLAIFSSLAGISFVAFGMTTGFVAIHPEQMMTSKSPLAWLTALCVFFMIVSITLSARYSFNKRVEQTLRLLERHEQELKTTNKKLREASAIIGKSRAVAFLRANQEGWPVEYVSENAERVFGYGTEEFLTGRITYRQVVHPDDLPRVGQELSRFIEEPGREEFTHEPYRILTKQGQILWVEDTIHFRKDLRGRITHYQGIVQDITERKRAEEELKTRTHQIEAVRVVAEEITRELNQDRLLDLILRRAVELTGAEGGAIDLVNETGRMLVPRVSFGEIFNPVLMAPFPIGEGVTGRVAESRNGMIVNDYRSWPGARPAVIQTTAIRAVLAEPMLYHEKVLGVITLANTDRKGSFEEHHLSTLRLFAGQAAIAIENARLYEEAQSDAFELQTRLQQIAEAEKEKEDLTRQLYQAQKLEAIGTLAGGIAHDFNNILAPIIMGAELALMTVPVENQAYPMIQKVLMAGMRAKDLVQQILAFSRQSDLERKPMRLGPLLKETIKLARASLPSTIEIRQNITAEKDMVLANPTQVHQVMMNLFANAGHAMRVSGGELEVTLENERVEDERAVGVLDIRKGHFAKLMVRDTGHGMDEGTLEKIFNPFFTTKQRGEGTGLGLSIVHGIVKSYDGAISVKSQPGQGTCFTIWIPLVEVEAKDRAVGSAPLPLGHERVLFVDDEPFIIQISRQILEGLGYKVDTRTDPLEALEVFKKDPDAYDLLITDMTMPKLTGDRLALEFLRIRPEMPILLCTGFSERITEAAALEMGIRGFIMKPIAVAEIARKIREVLGDQKAGG